MQRADCSNSENQKYLNDKKSGNPLPSNVIQSRENPNKFYTVKDSGLTEDERRLYRVEKARIYKNHQKLCFAFHGDSRNRSDCNFFVITAIKPVDKPQVIKYNIGTTIKSA